ncbi:DUF2111 domain-containing protein [Methanolobus psychrotolerans]|uniref:DUF2111 domain-containing protein n=1 Tax=Methanolobus psychrotolerans TaxID=1874706 RepID=UPI000B91842A|nr:DUF2111 domain-containing protein [Methanolobus psychrotolerans]
MKSKEESDGQVCMKLCAGSTANDMEHMAMAVHSLCGIPTTIRSINCKGIRIEKGKVVDREYTGPILEEVIRTDRIIRGRPTEGVYKGKCVVVAPIRANTGELVGAIGIVDIVASLDIYSIFTDYPEIVDEVEGERKKQKADLLNEIKEARKKIG